LNNTCKNAVCFNYSCNVATGICDPTPNPQPIQDLCQIGSCVNNAWTYFNVNTTCTGTDSCTNYFCNSSTGTCTTDQFYSNYGPNPKNCKNHPAPCFLKDDCAILNTNGCFNSTCVNDTGVCQLTPAPLPSLDQCRIYTCLNGVFSFTLKNCTTGNNPCLNYLCNSTDGTCYTTQIYQDPTHPNCPCNATSCVPPDSCYTTECNNATKYCDHTPKPSPNPDMCQLYKCVGGVITYTTKNCTGNNTQCLDYSCDNTTGLCDSVLKANAPPSCVTTVKCTADANCSYSDPCYVSACNTTSGNCYVTPTPNPFPQSFCYTSLCTGGVYNKTDIPCPVVDPCFIYTCDVQASVTKQICNASPDPNAPSSCYLKFNCTLKPEYCQAEDACFNATCYANGTCGITPLTCDQSDLCAPQSCVNGTCVPKPIICDDSNKCTNDTCVGGKCVFDTLPCVGTKCHTAACDAVAGCVVTPRDVAKFCDDNNLCTDDFCDNNTGCYYKTHQCPTTEPPPCYHWECKNYSGCALAFIVCTDNNTNFTLVGGQKNFSNTSGCLPYNKTCSNLTRGQCLALPTTCTTNLSAILGALAAGAIAAIVIAAIIAAALAGGAVYAVNGQIHAQRESEVLNNPLYQPSSQHGTNPLFRV